MGTRAKYESLARNFFRRRPIPLWSSPSPSPKSLYDSIRKILGTQISLVSPASRKSIKTELEIFASSDEKSAVRAFLEPLEKVSGHIRERSRFKSPPGSSRVEGEIRESEAGRSKSSAGGQWMPQEAQEAQKELNKSIITRDQFS